MRASQSVIYVVASALTLKAHAQLLNPPRPVPNQYTDLFDVLESPQKHLRPVPAPHDLVTRPDLSPEPLRRVPQRKGVAIQEAEAQAKPTPVAPEAPKEELSRPQAVLEDTHDLIGDNLISLADRVDSFLGTKRADDELNRSGLRLAYQYQVRDSYVPKTQTEVRFNIRLPKLEEKLHLGWRKNEPKKDPNPPGALSANQQVNQPKKEREREPWRFRTDTGVIVSIPVPNAFARARLRKNWLYSTIIPRFQHEMAWYTDRGWIQNTQFYFDRQLKKNTLFRFTNEADWRITGQRFITTHGPSIIVNTSDSDVWSYNARIGTLDERTSFGGNYAMSSYGLSVSYRRNLQGQWLFGEVTPSLDWPKALGWRRNPGILFRIESLFGRR